MDVTINADNYLFGFNGSNREGINHTLLELKKHIFYDWNVEIEVIAFCELFKSKIRSLIIKEKNIAQSNNQLVNFYSKWDNFTPIYDFRGPDMQIIF